MMVEEKLGGYPLSPLQRRLWKLEEAGGAEHYLARATVRLQGPLRIDRLKSAVETVVSRHEALRTSFPVLAGVSMPLQSIGAPNVRFEGFAGLSNGNGGPVAGRGASPETPIVACALAPSSGQSWLLTITVPALCADARSMGLIMDEICRIYARGGVSAEAATTLQYPDVAEWLNGIQEDRETLHGRQYWLNSISDLADSLPSCGPDSGRLEFSPSALTVNLSPAAEANLLAHETNQAGTLLALWVSLLERLGYATSLLAVVCDGRSEDLLKNTIGPLARRLPVKLHLGNETSVRGASAQADSVISEALEWQDYFDWELIERAGSGAKHLPYLPISFEYMQVGMAAAEGQEMLFSIEDLHAYIDRFDLHLSCKDYGDRLHCQLHWNQGQYTHDEIERLAASFAVTLSQAVEYPAAPIRELELIDASQRKRQLEDFIPTAVTFATDGKRLHELLEAQARRTPAAEAVRFLERSLTYAELNELAGRVAGRLSDRGIGMESLVGICLERSLDMAVAIFGVLKAGAAYVPLDPQFPSERLKFMVHDSRVKMVIVESPTSSKLDGVEIEQMSVEALCESKSEQCLLPVAAGGNPAYVIYTSGSTGAPKGTIISNRAIENHMAWMGREFPLSAHDRVLQKTSFSFDASVWEFFAPLLAGSCLVIARPGGQQDRDYLLQCIRDERITVLQLVPSQLRMLLDRDDLEQCTSLRLVFCGGESLPADWAERFHKALPNAALYNLYGPTEATIDATYGPYISGEGDRSVSIGKPIANVHAYVTDQSFKLLPVGAQGELCIAGVGLARGYLSRPDMTAEKFVPDPFSPRRGERMYRTGDRVMWGGDGRLHYVGRIDHQIKLRGYRVELGEIEAVLTSHAAVKEAAVVAREDEPGNLRLVGYLVRQDSGAGLTIDDLRSYLKARMPEYMVPSAFVELKQLPLTPTGKIDRRSLPRPEAALEQKQYLRPRNAVEDMLCEIFAEVLKLERVGIDESFMEVGGHSLLATQAISRIRKVFNVDLSLRALFEAPTARDLAWRIKDARGNCGTPPALELAARGENLPLSYAQQRLWVIDQLDPGSPAYNMPFSLRLKGELDGPALKRAFAALLDRHEVLRTTFPSLEGRPLQKIGTAAEWRLEEIDLSMMTAEEREAAASEHARLHANASFDLNRGPLLSVKLLRLDEQDHLLLITIHHIVSDGWSTTIMIRELAQLYNAYIHSEEPKLPELKMQYADFAVWQRRWLQGEVLQHQLNYWTQQLADLPPLELPNDFPRPLEKNYLGQVISFDLPEHLTEQLKALSRREGVTLFMTLLAAFKTILSRRSGQMDVAVGTGIANRNRLETESLIGFFVNTLVLRTRLSADMTFRELLAPVRHTTLEAYLHQDAPFEKLVQEMQLERDPGRTPLFQAMLVFQNMPQEPLRISGLEVSVLREEFLPVRSDLDLYLATGKTLEGTLVFDPKLFRVSTMREFLSDFKSLLEAVVADPETTVAELISMRQ